ncbi:phage virion morphogenesis protein [Pasteurella sp. PK-2025]|uniref:phage virion morphogenesis protein n=1 Tax=Pasteurella sp. PK-2025 TaxID=3413133 RepID=UPI003C74DDBE
MATIEEFNSKLTALLNNLSPTAQRELARKIGQNLVKSQRNRITAQQNPDGTAFAPRKPQKNVKNKKGRIKRKAMFAKLKTARFLKVKANTNQVSVGFTGNTAYLASVHQFGLVSRVHRKQNYKVEYAQRELLGFTEQDMDMIERLVIEQLGM